LHRGAERVQPERALPDSLLRQRGSDPAGGEGRKLQRGHHRTAAPTQRFANRFSVDKALRFEGRILDKEPIRIRVAKPKNPNDSANTASTIVTLRRREHLANFKQALGGTGRFREDFWGIVFAEVRRCDFEEQGKLANALLLWRMGVLLMGAGKHLQRHGRNARSNYILFQLERELMDRLDRRLFEVGRQVGVEVREARAWLWYSVAFPNTEEGSLCSTVRVEQGRRLLLAEPMSAAHREGLRHRRPSHTRTIRRNADLRAGGGECGDGGRIGVGVGGNRQR
jgi:hypothetical protein